MAELILGPMLRYVSETSATIWVETDAACTVTVLDSVVPTFCVAGHHYALVIIENLKPNSTSFYEVRLDGDLCWPAHGSQLPASRIRTLGSGISPRFVFGSCRSASPHEPPWSLDLALDPRGRGVDALYAFALGMVAQPAEEWPHLAVFLGDQVYADEAPPKARERIAESRKRMAGEKSKRRRESEADLPAKLVAGFEEYTWLYHESWAPEFERWFFSNVPSVMIFDDHEMIDDWNISEAWVRKIRTHDWWEDHVTGGLMTYWLYQHLGNLSPEAIRSEGLVEALSAVVDGEAVLRDWAMGTEEFTPLNDRDYQFNFVRDVGRVRLVMLDTRNARVLEPNNRQIIDGDQWQWMVDACNADVDHLLIGTSLPVFVPGGLHDLQVWSEAICDGAWGWPGRKIGEWLRLRADMEDWPAFLKSFNALVDLLGQLGARSRADAPATISVLTGDIHFSFVTEVRFPETSNMGSRVHQLASSPIRNALMGPEREALRLGASRFAELVGRVLRRAARRRRTEVAWKVDHDLMFANSLSQLDFAGRSAELVVLKVRDYDEHAEAMLDRFIEVDLVVGAAAKALVDDDA